MTERFLKYSLERKVRIAAVLLLDGKIKKNNLQVLSMEPESFSALLSGKKKPTTVRYEDVMTASYARGDHGALEDESWT